MATPKFKFLTWRERKQQHFDKENITLTKANKTFNVYDYIQEGREDTEIEPTLKKYGCIPTIREDNEALYQSFGEYKDLRGVLDQKIKAEQMFYSLPVETREKFGNDINKFTKEGGTYVKKIIDAEIAKKAALKAEEEKLTSQTITTETNNG